MRGLNSGYLNLGNIYIYIGLRQTLKVFKSKQNVLGLISVHQEINANLSVSNIGPYIF